jgi:hypothetical protein
MSYNFDPREALKQVCEAAAENDHFPPPSAGRSVSDAIDVLKANGADPQQVAIAEGLSVLLYRFEVSTWAQDGDEARKVRESIAAQISELPALVDYHPVEPECSILELSMESSLSGSHPSDYPEVSYDDSHLHRNCRLGRLGKPVAKRGA